MKTTLLFILTIIYISTAAATTTYGIITPNTLEYPGRVESSGEVTHPFLVVNGTNVYEMDVYNATNYNLGIRLNDSAAHIVFAVYDWAHPWRMFVVDTDKNVFYIDTPAKQDLSLGFYTTGTWPEVCSNCNPIYKIGVLTTLNTKLSGRVDSNGDLYLAEGLSIVKFVRDSDYAKTTYLTLVSGTDFVAGTWFGSSGGVTAEISDMAIDSDGKDHIMIGETAFGSCGACNGGGTAYGSHVVFSGSTRIYTQTLYSASAIGSYGTYTATTLSSDILIDANQTNSTLNIIYAYVVEAVVYLKHQNNTGTYDICPTSCGIISGLNGLQIYGGYAYIASSAENKIYRFPSTITQAFGMGFGGVTAGAGLVNYTTKTVNFEYPTQYNNTEFRITYALKFTLNNTIKTNQGSEFQWYITTTNPTGATVADRNQIITKCEQAQEWWTVIYNPLDWSCSAAASFYIDPPAANWTNGTYTTRLYENVAGVESILATDTTNVLNESGFTGITTPGTTPPGIITIAPGEGWGTITDENSKSHTVDILDNWVGTMGMGVNNTTRLWFAVIVIIFAVIIGAIIAKDTIVSVACGFLPFAFFASISLDPAAQAAGIEFIPKWAIAMFIIILALAVKVLR